MGGLVRATWQAVSTTSRAAAIIQVGRIRPEAAAFQIHCRLQLSHDACMLMMSILQILVLRNLLCSIPCCNRFTCG